MTEEEVSMFDEITIRAQRAARSGNWRLFKKILLEQDNKRLLESFDLFGNTAIHIATRSNNPRLLQELLLALSKEDRWHALRKGNCVNNTLLHEIRFCTNVEMAGVVFMFEKEELSEVAEEKKGLPLVEVVNDSGETPLFRAAKLGKLKMLKYMAKHSQGDIRRLFVRFDKHSILHASILGQFFDVAIWLLNMDEKLALHKDMNGVTCLQLLSNMPPVFRRQSPSMGTMKDLIYYLLPEEGYEIDDEDVSVDFRQRSDLESGIQDKAKLPCSGIPALERVLNVHQPHEIPMAKRINHKCMPLLT